MRPGPVNDEEVGKSRNGDAEVGIRSTPPHVMEVDSVAASDFQRPQYVGVPESGGVDDDIGVVGDAVRGDDAAPSDLADRQTPQFDVVPLQCSQPAAVVLQ